MSRKGFISRFIDAFIQKKPIAKKNTPEVKKIPEYRKELLFISNESPKSHGYGLEYTISISDSGSFEMNKEIPDDPSTIYSILKAVDSENSDKVPKLPYYPSYSQMKPEQRGLYLRWLYDVTKKIEIGYVFIYYYGLERQLIYGDFDAAFDEIRLLRNFHSNISFQSYSASALVHSCLLRRRVDRLKQLYESEEFDYFGNSNLLILYYNDIDITPDMMFHLASNLSGVNRRYIKLHPDLYKEKISEILIEKFGDSSFPLSSKYDLDEVKGIPYPIFANISLPSEIRTPQLPNILKHPPFQKEMIEIYYDIHNAVKSELKERRKTKKNRIK